MPARLADENEAMDTQYRAELDFDIIFSNGGSLHGQEFRIGIAGPISPSFRAGSSQSVRDTQPGVLPGSAFRFTAVPPKVARFGPSRLAPTRPGRPEQAAAPTAVAR